MANKTISISGWSGSLAFSLYVNEKSYDAINNTSVVEWTLTASGGGGSWYDFYLKASINGTSIWNESGNWSKGSFPAADGSASGTLTISHSADGTKSISLNIEGYRYVYSTRTASGTLALTNIDRTAPTVAFTTVERGVNTIKITATSNVDCNSWDYSLNNGSSWVNFSTANGRSVTYTIPNLTVNTRYQLKVRARKKLNYIYGSSAMAEVSTLGISTGTDLTGIMGQVLPISWTRYNETFTHTIVYQFGEASGTICTGAATSYNWTVPMNLANQIPNSVSGTGTYTIYTYDGNTLIGSNTYELTLNVPDSVVPTFSQVLSEGTTSGFSRYVAGLSTLRAVLTTAGAYGSTVKTAQMLVQGTTYTTNVNNDAVTLNSNVLQLVETSTVELTITDSRGRTATHTVNITVYEYFAPRVEDIEFDINGTTIKVKATGEVAPVNNQNNAFVTVKKKRISDQTETTVVSRIALINLTEAQKYVLDHEWTFTVSDIQTESYEYSVLLEDKKGTTTYKEQTGIVCVSYHAGGDGATFGGEASSSGFVMKWISKFLDKIGIHTANPDYDLDIQPEDSSDDKLLRVGSVDFTLTDDEAEEIYELLDLTPDE